MERVMISSYQSVIDKNDKDIELLAFLDGVKDGKWQDAVLKVRTIQDKKERNKEKQKCPLVTISGSFKERKDNAIRKHSNVIAIDLDNISNPNTVKEVLKRDSYVFASFISISGHGLCVLFKIDGSRHLDAFESIAKYLYDNYQLIVDQSGKNVSRARFVSYDPYLHLNENAIVFKKYLPKQKPKKEHKVVFVKSDFDNIVKQFYDRSINICEDYTDWVTVAYSLISHFGESGRSHFHTLSSISAKYNYEDTDRQYDSCMRNYSEQKSKVSTIASIYYYAKLHGLEIYSEKTKDIIRAAATQHKSGVKAEDIQKSLYEYSNITPEDSKDIVDQVIQQNISFESENLIDDLVHFLKPYNLKKNTITRNIEKNKKPIDDSDINSIFLDAKTVYKDVTKDLVCSVLFSNRIEQYNPIHQFLTSQDLVNEYPNLEFLIKSVVTDTPNADKWITKWLVSMIASAYGKHSPLMLVFAGELQGTGKTHWFRYLLPQHLQPLFAESKMDGGKDDEILMTKKWIILDDEFGGKSKREEKRLKEITSKAWINVREPYGRVSVDLRRLAVFCGTSNDTQILNDPTGNRRILPIHILGINHDMYNKCDKEMLMIELYSLYKSGYDYSILKSEIEELNQNTDDFKQASVEEELIIEKLMPGEEGVDEWINITSIIQYLIADTKINSLVNKRVGLVLTSLGYKKRRVKLNGSVVTGFLVKKVYGMVKEVSELPF